jgi:hypothetical protein
MVSFERPDVTIVSTMKCIMIIEHREYNSSCHEIMRLLVCVSELSSSNLLFFTLIP